MTDERFKVICKNCLACEWNEESGYYCDLWSTDIFEVTKAFCSEFTPHPIDQKGEQNDEER